MGASAKSSPPPADALLSELVGSAWKSGASSEPRAKSLPLAGSKAVASLRAGDVPRRLHLLNPTRAAARKRGANDLEEARLAAGVSLEDLAASFGLDACREGAELTSGKGVVTHGELAELTPLSVFLRVVAISVSRRVTLERVGGRDPSDARLVAHCLDTLRSLLT